MSIFRRPFIPPRSPQPWIPGAAASGTTYNDSITETGTASDSLSASATVAANVSEAGTSSDALAAAATINASISETGTATDAVSDSGGTVYSDSITETVTAADSLATTATMAASVSEAGSSADSLAVDGTQTYSDSVSESGSAGDSLGVDGGTTTTQSTAGGWLSLPDYRKGRDEYVRRQRIAMGILPAEQPAAPIVIPEAVKVVAQRQAGLRMSTRQREADLARELANRQEDWREDYAAALYSELYRIEKQRREDDLIVALLAA